LTQRLEQHSHDLFARPLKSDLARRLVGFRGAQLIANRQFLPLACKLLLRL
jgi:hypothetical protein